MQESTSSRERYRTDLYVEKEDPFEFILVLVCYSAEHTHTFTYTDRRRRLRTRGVLFYVTCVSYFAPVVDGSQDSPLASSDRCAFEKSIGGILIVALGYCVEFCTPHSSQASAYSTTGDRTFHLTSDIKADRHPNFLVYPINYCCSAVAVFPSRLCSSLRPKTSTS